MTDGDEPAFPHYSSASDLSDFVSRIDALLSRVTRYNANICGDCDCCGSFVEFEPDKDGDYVKFEELNDLIELLKDGCG